MSYCVDKSRIIINVAITNNNKKKSFIDQMKDN